MLQQEQQEYWTRKLTHNGKPWMGPDQYEDTGNAAALANHHHHHTGNGGGNKNSGNSNASSNSSYGGSGGGGQLCRLPSDMVLLYDPEFKKWVELYARDRNRFFDDFSKAFAKLLELGVPFPPPPRPWWKRWFWFFW
jgi:cytochrome c peroxidase